MIKVALATDSILEMKHMTKLLTEQCDVVDIDEQKKGGQQPHVTILTITSIEISAIEEMFELLESATGIDPRKTKSKKKSISRVSRAACYLLYYRFNLSHIKIAAMLGYANHASSLTHCNRMPKINVDKRKVIIELAVRRVLEVKTPDNRKGRTAYGHTSSLAKEL